jgi:regulatory protein YycI of two-component signal transduction system YycFG
LTSFTVSYSEEILVTNKTVIVAVSSTFAVILLILIIFVRVKYYYDKVNISNLLVSKKSVSEKLKTNRPI